MAWGFRRSIKVFPGVRLNIGKRGISTSIGVRGAHVTVGSSGTSISTGIPGTGIYYRQKLGGGTNPARQTNSPQDQSLQQGNLSPELGISNLTPIESEDIDSVSSISLESLKQSIVDAYEQKKTLNNELNQVKKEIVSYQGKKSFRSLPVLRILFKSSLLELDSKIQEKSQDLSEINGSLNECIIDIDVEFEPEFENAYENVVHSFDKIRKSTVIWDITSHNPNTSLRSSIGSAVTRVPVTFGIGVFDVIKSKYPALFLQNANGADMFVFPGFLLMRESSGKIGLVELTSLNIIYSNERFIELGTIPTDTKILDYTWQKTNVDGSRDKRYKSNRQMPIVQYGKLHLSTTSGINEAYYVSCAETTMEFGKELNNYIELLKKHSAS